MISVLPSLSLYRLCGVLNEKWLPEAHIFKLWFPVDGTVWRWSRTCRTWSLTGGSMSVGVKEFERKTNGAGRAIKQSQTTQGEARTGKLSLNPEYSSGSS